MISIWHDRPEQTYPNSYDAFGVLGGINPKTQPSQNPESVLTFGREFQRGFGPQNPTPPKTRKRHDFFEGVSKGFGRGRQDFVNFVAPFRTSRPFRWLLTGRGSY